MNWDDEASCRSADPDLFFPADPDRSSRRDGPAGPQLGQTRFSPAAAAVRVCRGCPVRTQCLEFALSARLDYGVWGGLTEQERRSLRRSRQRRARRLASVKVA